jgi:hypothetical protein
MLRAALADCVPWLVWLCAAAAVGWLLLRAAGSRWRWRRLARLHADQHGAVQSLSFVLTMPLFVLVVLFIIQVSQLMIATFTVHYAAYAAARSAIVWIPADAGSDEGANCIGPNGSSPPSTHAPSVRATEYGLEYRIGPAPMHGARWQFTPKLQKIHFAAALACMAICPSRDLEFDADGQPVQALQRVYLSLDAEAAQNERIPQRLRNKLAYSLANTTIEVRILHPDADPPHREPPLAYYWWLGDEFKFNEYGWQDQITVIVRHRFALLPGPGRLLANTMAAEPRAATMSGPPGEPRVRVYARELVATCTLGNEGEKPVLPYRISVDGKPIPVTVPEDYVPLGYD